MKCSMFQESPILTDSSGEITDTYVYDAFGVEIYRTGTTLNDYLYTGQEYDANIGFYYLRARYMDCKTGRFINMDTYWGSNYDPVSLHKYLYANANPVMNYDPTGNFSLGHVLVGITISSVLAGIVSGIFAFIRTGSFKEALWAGAKSMLITAAISLLLLKFPALLPFVMILGVGSLIYQAATGQFDGLSVAELVTHIVVQAVFWFAFKTYVSTPSNNMVDVTRWGRPGLKPKDWVMPGGKTLSNYIRSFKWDPFSPTNQVADMASGQTFTVPKGTIQWPSGWGMDGWWKGLFGQRIYLPGGGMSSSIFDVFMGGSIFSSILEDFIWFEDENVTEYWEGE